MGARKDITYLQFRDATPNSVLGWTPSGVAFHMGVFSPATSLLDGSIGLVPKPVAGQQLYILSNNGWIANSGGGVVGGSGVANKLSYWSDVGTITSNTAFGVDVTNTILKTPTINLSRAALPSGGIADGDVMYLTTVTDLIARVGGEWVLLSTQDEAVLPIATTDYTVTAAQRNMYIITSSNSPVVIRFPNTLIKKFSCIVVKGGAGNVTLVAQGGTSPSMLGESTVITTLYGAVAVYHSEVTLNTWRAYGNLG